MVLIYKHDGNIPALVWQVIQQNQHMQRNPFVIVYLVTVVSLKVLSVTTISTTISVYSGLVDSTFLITCDNVESI